VSSSEWGNVPGNVGMSTCQTSAPRDQGRDPLPDRDLMNRWEGRGKDNECYGKQEKTEGGRIQWEKRIQSPDLDTTSGV